MRKAGYLDEVKSILSEFMQYDIRDSEIQEMIEDSSDRALLQMKLKDVSVLYQAFTGYLKDHYMTGEEVMDALEKLFLFQKDEKQRSSSGWIHRFYSHPDAGGGRIACCL